MFINVLKRPAERLLKYFRDFIVKKIMNKKFDYFKGTWQRGGFSGVFAEIGSA
jgi:hypothetical protein